jgi:hypothetical protein
VDTRTKIVDAPRLAGIAAEVRRSGGRLRIVRGYFDVLIAPQVRRLRELSDRATLVVALDDPPEPVLAARARAELVAALEPVDYVIIAGGAPLPEAGELIDESVLHAELFQELVRHVHGRKSA